MSEMRRFGARMVHLHTTCTKEGESEEEEVEQAVQLTLWREQFRHKERRICQCRVVEIREVRGDNERSVRGIHCAERGKDSKKGVVEHSTIFFAPLYWAAALPGAGYDQLWLGGGHDKKDFPGSLRYHNHERMGSYDHYRRERSLKATPDPASEFKYWVRGVTLPEPYHAKFVSDSPQV